ncbi:MAG: PAS domain-containing protein [Candidatus Thiodiazotropha sp.]|jgi:PAS domain S-box-containing protein
MTQHKNLLTNLLWFMLLILCGDVYARSEISLDFWRQRVTEVRLLAENRISQAHAEAQDLLDSLPLNASASDQARLYNMLARIEMYVGETDRAKELIDTAREFAKGAGDNIGLIEAALNTAFNAVNQGDIETLRNAVEDALLMLDGMDRPDLLAEVLLRAAMTSLHSSQLDEAVSASMRNLEIAKQSGDPLAYTYAEQGMAIIHSLHGRYDEARGHYVAMGKFAQAAGSLLLEADSLLGLGVIDFRLGDPLAGERKLLTSLSMYRKAGAPFYVAHTNSVLAKELFKQGRSEEALAQYKMSAGIYEKHNNPIGLWWTLFHRSLVRQEVGELSLAHSDALRAYTLAEQIGFPIYRAKSADRLASIKATQGNHTQAYQLLYEAAQLNEQLHLQESGERILALAKRFQAEAKQRKIDELTERNRRQALRQWWLWTAISGGGLLLLISLVFLWRLRHSREEIRALNANLEQANRQLRNQVEERCRAQDELAARERGFRALGQNAPDIIARHDLDTRFLYVNPQLEQSLGIEAAEIIGKTCIELFPDKQRVIDYEATMRLVIETGDPAEVEAVLPDIGEGVRYYSMRLVAEYDKQGRIVDVLAIGRDITERKHAEAQLQASEHRYRVLVENFPDMLVRFDSECRFTYANSVVTQNFGITKNELCGKRQREQSLYGSERQTRELEACIRRVFVTGEPNEYEARWKILGREAIFEVRHIPEKDVAGNVVSVLGICRDITRLRETEQALHNREREFRTLAENLPDSLIRYNQEFRVTYANPLAAWAVSSCPNDIIGMTAFELLPDPEQVQRYGLALSRVIRTGEPEKIELILVDGAQEEHIYQISFVAERRGNGEVRGALAIGREVTQFKKIERRLEESHAQLQALAQRQETAREEERKHIARELHDELGQYLTALGLRTLVLSIEYGDGNPSLRVKLESMLSLVEHTKKVTRNLSQRLRPAVLDMGIDSALEMLVDGFVSQYEIPCVLELGPEMKTMSDTYKIVVYRVVQESLTNIARYSEARKAEVILKSQDGIILLEIRDDGKGFDPSAVQPNAFGLVGMRERMLAVGGELEVISESMRGTRIISRMPQSEN